MSVFNKDLFSFDGMYLMYGSENRKFVARFKGRGDRAGFVKFLMKNFTPCEYFGALAAGGTPVGVLETKGYVSATVKKILKSCGYEPTFEGKEKYLADQVAKYIKA
jgi:hypothetical protein